MSVRVISKIPHPYLHPKLRSTSAAVIGDIVVQVPPIVHVGEPVEDETGLRALKDVRYREDAMGVELDALRTDGHRKVELPSASQYARQVLESSKVAVVVDRITVSAKAEVLQCVQARQGVTALDERVRQSPHQVRAHEADGGCGARERPDVDDVDLPVYGNVRHEAVHSGSDVDMAIGLGRVDTACDQQVLVEVLPLGRAAVRDVVAEAGVVRSYRELGPPRERRLVPERFEVMTVWANASQRVAHHPQVDPRSGNIRRARF